MEAECIQNSAAINAHQLLLSRSDYPQRNTIARCYITSQQFYFNIQDLRSRSQHRNADKLDLDALYLR